jgi:hypothetical protein
MCVIVDNAGAQRGPRPGPRPLRAKRIVLAATADRGLTAASPPANSSAAAITVNTSIEVSRCARLVNHSTRRLVFAAQKTKSCGKIRPYRQIDFYRISTERINVSVITARLVLRGRRVR